MPRVPGGLGTQLFGIGVFVTAGIIPDVTTPQFWATSQGESVVRQERVVYDQTSTPVFVPAAPTTPIDSTLASVHSSATVVTSRVVYDQQAARPVFPPVVTDIGRFVPDGPQSGFTRSRIKPIQLSAFVFAIPIDDLATNDGYEDAFVRVIRPKRKVLPDSIAQPPYPPVVAAPPATIDSTLASVHSAASVILARVVYDQTAARPVYPPTAVVTLPAFLFDNIGPVKVTPPNRTAIRIDLQGAVWPPQDPLSLTGVPPVVEPPVTEPPPSGGYTGGRVEYRKFRLKKRWRDECEELLEYLQGLPPAQAQEICEQIPLERLSLLEMLPQALPHGIVIPQGPRRPMEDDEDEDEIALLLEILNRS